ncbi:MAG: VOC family protein [Anaerolineae bacterium]|nr:VOC family protein [Anaerolineae bacterium]
MLKSIRNLDYTIIFCRDIEAMKHFYRDILGFPVSRDSGTWVEFQLGSVRLTLNSRGSGYDGVREHHGAPLLDGAGLQLAFRVAPAEVDSCFDELQQKGVSILQPPTTHQRTNHRTLFFKDPENNILEIYAEV